MPIYPTEIAEPLTSRINDLEKLEYFQRPKVFPNDEDLQSMIDTSFHASLLTEEGRRPGFRLLYCSPADITGESNRFGW